MAPPKQTIKFSEARILVFLETADTKNCYARFISAKLNIDYGYLLSILSGMHARGWIIQRQIGSSKHYSISDLAPLAKAKERIVQEANNG